MQETHATLLNWASIVAAQKIMLVVICVGRACTLPLMCIMLFLTLPLSTHTNLVEGFVISRAGFFPMRYGNIIPTAPVQGQATSCSLDLSDELLGGVKAACMPRAPLDKRHCCPVLAAWLMAARAKFALHPPLQQEPGMPLLPDDSLVCIASLKAALAARGIFIATPASPLNASEPCDVVTCFCGIHLASLTSQSCPLPFSGMALNSIANNSSSSNSSSLSQPTLPHLVQHEYSSPNQQNSKLNKKLIYGHDDDDEHISYKKTIMEASKDLPIEPSQNGTSIDLPTGMSPPPSASPKARSPTSSNLLQLLAANCTDHSYRGCTRCLKTLRKEMRSDVAKGIIRGSNEKATECEMIGLMSLLELNKTLYIPTVSAVVRALLYNDEHDNITKCSLDTDNMPLALDYSELLFDSSSALLNLISQSFNPTLITLLISLCVAINTNFYLLL